MAFNVGGTNRVTISSLSISGQSANPRRRR
jgi:hypothetical protein